MKKVTVAQIARKAGVSPATVSNALNHRKGTLTEEKRQQILNTAKELGYTHVKRKKRICLLLAQHPDHPVEKTLFFKEQFQGIKDVCEENGCVLQVNHVNINEWKDVVCRLEDELNADGYLIHGALLTQEDIDLCLKIQTPFVLMDNVIPNPGFNVVTFNNRETAYVLTKYLISKGHRNIGFLGSGLPIGNHQERMVGYLQALHDNRIETNHIYMIPAEIGNVPDQEKMAARVKKIMSLKNPPTAYCAVNDKYAIVFCRVMRELGISVSVTGFNNIPESALCTPSLTTVQLDQYDLGVNAMKRLLHIIVSPDSTPVKIYLSGKIIERDSVFELNKQ